MKLLRGIGALNVLLIFVPTALVLHWRETEAVWVFVASAVAIVA